MQSQRNDRQVKYDRNKAPQDAMVSHIISMNAQSFVHLSHARLCYQAETMTRWVVSEMVRLATESNPEMESVLVPRCEYRNGKCSEFNCCGYNKKFLTPNI